MSESTNNQTTGSQGNQGQQGNVAGVNQGVQNTYNVSVGEKAQQRQIDRNICRKMLQQQIQLTSNTVLGRVYGDRNLIDEDLFVDLALVKPKRSKHEKHPQEIDPEKGSDLFTRQEETIEKRFAYREFLQEVISNRSEKQLAIIGEPGAGKTTLLQKLAFWLFQETDDLVIWVSLAELGNQPLGEYLEQKWLKEALGKSREEIKADWEHKFKGGAVWLLLDGLDEMSQSDLQGLKFRGWVMNAPIIVTCRLNLWQANPSQLQGFQTYLTQPFQDEQVQEFIRRWFPGLLEKGEDPEKAVQLAASLWSELQESGKERIKDLCRNPLRLTLLCATWNVEKALPDTMTELYAGFVEAIYKWKKKAFIVKKEEKKQLNAALGALAKKSLEAETSRFRLTHRLVCEYLGEPDEDSLLDKALQLGWLNEVGVAAESPREKVYGFYHATFQEYFAALAVADWDDFLPRDHCDRPAKGKPYRIFEPQWKQVILLWFGREDIKAKAEENEKEKEEFIRALVEFEDACGEWNFDKVGRGFYEYPAYFLAAAAINEFKDCCLADEIVRQVVKWGLGYFNIEKLTFLNLIQEGARKAIHETIRKKAINALEQILLDDADADNRSQAAKNLGEIDPGNQNAIAVLLEIIDTTENEDTRWYATQYLEEIGVGNPDAIAGLLKIIRTTENKSSRLQAAQCLKQICVVNSDAIAGLLKIIDTTENEDTRWLAAQCLEEIGIENLDAIAGLLKIIDTTENECSRFQATDSLKKVGFGNLQAIAGLLKIIDTTENKCSRFWAAQCLEEIGVVNPDAIAGLLKIIRTTENKSSRLQAAQCLKQICVVNSDAIAGLLKIIDTTKDEYTRWLAAQCLEEIGVGNLQAIAGLLRIIDTTENEFSRWLAYQCLKKVGIGNLQAITGLLKIIRTTENKCSRSQAAQCLEEIGVGNPDAMIARLLKIIDTTKNEYTRLQAAESLREIDPGNQKAINALEEILRDAGADDFIRWRAAYSLGEIDPGKQTAINALEEILRDAGADNFTRSQAAEILGEIDPGNQQAIAALVEILRDAGADSSIRWTAAESLGKIAPGNQQAINALVQILGEAAADSYTRRQAALGLNKIGQGNPEAVEALLNLIATTEHEETRSNAAWSLGKILTTRQQYVGVVSALKDCLSDEVYQNDFNRFDECYKVIWHCTENLSYPDFYQAWHHPTTTPHPEVTDQTPHDS